MANIPDTDPKATLKGALQSAALAIFSARAGERLVGKNRLYAPADAIDEAAQIITLALTNAVAADAFARAAAEHKCQSVWLDSSEEKGGQEEMLPSWLG